LPSFLLVAGEEMKKGADDGQLDSNSGEEKRRGEVVFVFVTLIPWCGAGG